MATIIGENGGDSLQDFACISPCHHEAEKACTGQSGDVLSSWVVRPCAPHRGLQQQLEKRLWKRKK